MVTREALISGGWDFASNPDPNVLDVHIRNLRSKVDKPFDSALITTVRGVGYRLSLT
ncbi:MAG: helix-turn-helix domain-containing protein [Acidimicrobiales bacterium]